MKFLNEIDKSWTLFLDRDGVINHEKEKDYIRNVSEFVFYKGAKEALAIFAKQFSRILIVTNQRGIGKGLMSVQDLEEIHQFMQDEIAKAGGRIDGIYFAPDLETEAENRKPNTGMALQAIHDFPAIDFGKSIMIGNNLSDMQFGKKMNMKTVFVCTTRSAPEQNTIIDFVCADLYDFSKKLLNL